MSISNIHDAKTHFSRLVERVEAGEEVIIAKAGRPVARLVPYRLPKGPPFRKPGSMKGKIRMSRDFDRLPDEIVQAFRGDLP